MSLDIKNTDLKKASILILGLALLTGFVLLQPNGGNGESADFNSNNVMFMNMMIVHHD
jgi:preprotein translocase subunit SecG